MEILSPAGSFEALSAAVHYGADAVYAGGSRFNARRHAQNFSDEALEEAVDFCHLHGVKFYLCCNTLVKENEYEEAMQLIRHAYRIGVDALIMQDLGLIERVRQELPDFPIHGSTQMTVVNSGGVKLLEELGLQRVVLAREVTKQGIQSILKHTKAELEYFVHGALCISYSGQCLMSSILGGRSGNRGGCAQPCRLSYTLLENGKAVTGAEHVLCPKDLCLADRVSELKTMGVSSLKIEGRMKSPAYVAMVTQVYKKAAEGAVTDDEIRQMLKFFSRGGSCHGYWEGCTYQNMMDTAGNAKKVADSLPTIAAQEKKQPMQLRFFAEPNKPLMLSAEAAEQSVTVRGDVCETAHTHPTEAARVEEQLKKLGGTVFYAESVSVQLSPVAAVPIKEINRLRREAVLQLEKQVTGRYKRSLPTVNIKPHQRPYTVCGQPVLSAEVRTEEQLAAAVAMGIERIYLPAALWQKANNRFDSVLLLSPLTKEGEQLPQVDTAQVCVQNLGQILAFDNRQLAASHRLNITNSRSTALLQSLGVRRMVVSPELNLKGIHALRQQSDAELEVIAYGRLPLMLLEHCVIRSTVGCRCDSAAYALKDRKNEIFPLVSTHCGNIVYNSKPIYMADRLSDIKNLQINGLRLCFTLENYETCCIIIREYQNAMVGHIPHAPDGGFTRGHFYRGMQ